MPSSQSWSYELHVKVLNRLAENWTEYLEHLGLKLDELVCLTQANFPSHFLRRT